MENKNNNQIPVHVDKIDWASWQPTECAVLSFIRDGNRLMLIRKKTGLGAGKINAPGGRIAPGETAMQAAIRETIEEICMEPINPRKMGELFFQFTDGYKLHGEVFFSTEYTGEPRETDEADPFWCTIEDLPYHEMWADDRLWLPLALEGKSFVGYFIFDDDTMLDNNVICL